MIFPNIVNKLLKILFIYVDFQLWIAKVEFIRTLLKLYESGSKHFDLFGGFVLFL